MARTKKNYENSIHYSQLPIGSPTKVLSVTNLKGANGSGKTALVKQALFGKGDYLYVMDDSGKPVGVWSKPNNLLSIGVYEPEASMGGCDRLPDMKSTKDLLTLFWNCGLDILFEGVVISTIKSTFYEYCSDLCWLYQNYQPRIFSVAFLDTDLPTCLSRIKIRNGGKDINEVLVKNKYRAVQNHQGYYRSEGVPTIIVPSMQKPVDFSADYLIDSMGGYSLSAQVGSIPYKDKYFNTIIRSAFDSNKAEGENNG